MAKVTGLVCLACSGFAMIVACGSSYAEATAPDGGPDAGTSGEAGVAREAGSSAEAGGTCSSDCQQAGPSCSAVDFSTGCPSGLVFTGNTTAPGVVGECAGGKMHVAAQNTLDIVGTLAASGPAQFDALHVSARVAVTKWDGGALLTVAAAMVPVAEVHAAVGAGGATFTVCIAGSCAAAAGATKLGVESVLTLDITRSAVSLSVDCGPPAMQAATVTFGTPFAVSFGKTDAESIDGTLDDLVVSFR